MAKAERYDEKSIQVLEGLEAKNETRYVYRQYFA